MSKSNREMQVEETLWDEFEGGLRHAQGMIERAKYLGYTDLAEKMQLAV